MSKLRRGHSSKPPPVGWELMLKNRNSRSDEKTTKDQNELEARRSWSQTAQVILLSFSVEVGAITGFVVVMWYVGKAEAFVTLIRNNLAISLTGGCAFYVTLLILMKWVVGSFMKHTYRKSY